MIKNTFRKKRIFDLMELLIIRSFNMNRVLNYHTINLKRIEVNNEIFFKKRLIIKF